MDGTIGLMRYWTIGLMDEGSRVSARGPIRRRIQTVFTCKCNCIV